MNNKYKNSYIVKEKELVSLSVYNVGFQSCDSLYQWGPGIRDHYLIHYIISGKGRYTVNGSVHTLTPGDVRFVHIEPQKKHLAYLVVQKSFSVKHLVCMVSVQSTIDKLCRIYCQPQLLPKLSECRRYIVHTGRYVSRA